MISDQRVILGPPGTGKTTTLLNILEKELSHGVSPYKIAFVSFTRKGAYEAKERVVERFDLHGDDLPYFRTLHSMAYRQTGASNAQVMKRQDYTELGELLGLEFKMRGDVEEMPGLRDSGDRLLFLEGYARNTMQSPKDVWRKYGEDINWFTFKQFIQTYQKYKAKRGYLDFTNIIESFIQTRITVPVEVAIIDEAQDLSALQWKMVEIAFANAKRIYIAGDDDQAIYKWSGADVKKFLSLKGDMVYLNQSHRMPEEVFKIAQRISKQIKQRYPKEFLPREGEGSVTFHNDPDQLWSHLSKGDWLLLARNRYMLKDYREMVEMAGYIYTTSWGTSTDPNHITAIYAWERARKKENAIPFQPEDIAFVNQCLPEALQVNPGQMLSPQAPVWHDAMTKIPMVKREYYRAILRRGGGKALVADPRIHIRTIHSVKGGEADNVAVMTDMSYKTYQTFQQEADDEHRVFYVGMTRTRKNLHIILPQTEKGYIF